jgi:4-amino-4-deoxy-L-arabinose transferase-like glycosyltransferase
MEKNIKSDTPILLQRLALILFFIFPVALSIVSQIFVLIHSWYPIKIVQFSLLVVIFLIPVFLILAKNSIWVSIEQYKYVPMLWVVGLAIVLRIILVQLISSDFVSDMEDIHFFAVDISSGNPMANLQNYPNIPSTTYLTMTGIVLSIIYKIFGASTAIAKLTLIILAGLTTWLIFLVGKRIANAQVGFIASLLYAILPSLICFTGILTGDHFALPLMMLVVLLQIRLGKLDQEKTFYHIAGYILCGVLIGLVDWFRPIGMTLLAALIISILIFQFKKQVLFRTMLALVLLMMSYFTVSKMAIVITENMFQTTIPSLFQRIGAYVLVGLNPETTGGVNLEDAQTVGETYNRFGSDYSAANRYLTEMALDRLEEGELAKLFKEKFVLIWSSHDALFDYPLNGSNDQELVNLLRDFEALLYLVITVFILFNAFSSIRWQSNFSTFAMQLFILGFALLMLVFEVQNRYVIIVIPFSILLGVLGMKDAFSMKTGSVSS